LNWAATETQLSTSVTIYNEADSISRVIFIRSRKTIYLYSFEDILQQALQEPGSKTKGQTKKQREIS
jgi:hypothetical protein